MPWLPSHSACTLIGLLEENSGRTKVGEGSGVWVGAGVADGAAVRVGGSVADGGTDDVVVGTGGVLVG